MIITVAVSFSAKVGHDLDMDREETSVVGLMKWGTQIRRPELEFGQERNDAETVQIGKIACWLST